MENLISNIIEHKKAYRDFIDKNGLNQPSGQFMSHGLVTEYSQKALFGGGYGINIAETKYTGEIVLIVTEIVRWMRMPKTVEEVELIFGLFVEQGEISIRDNPDEIEIERGGYKLVCVKRNVIEGELEDREIRIWGPSGELVIVLSHFIYFLEKFRRILINICQ